MSDSVQPHRRQPTRLPHPWDSPGKNTGVGCHFLLQCKKVKSESEVAQSCPTLSDPMNCSLPGSSIHGIFQARVLEWGAIAFSDGQLQISFKVTRSQFPKVLGGNPKKKTNKHLFEIVATGMTAGGQSISELSLAPKRSSAWRLGTGLRRSIQTSHICRKQAINEAEWRKNIQYPSSPTAASSCWVQPIKAK